MNSVVFCHLTCSATIRLKKMLLLNFLIFSFFLHSVNLENKFIFNDTNNTIPYVVKFRHSKKSILMYDHDCIRKIFFNNIRNSEIKYLLPLDRFEYNKQCKRNLLDTFALHNGPINLPKLIGGKKGCELKLHKIITLTLLVKLFIGFVEYMKLNNVNDKLLDEFENMLREMHSVVRVFLFKHNYDYGISKGEMKFMIMDMAVERDRPIECLIGLFIHTYITIM